MIIGLVLLGAILAACFLSSVIMYLEYVNRLKPNSAIKLNIYNAVYAYKKGEKEIPIYISYFTYVYLAFLCSSYKKHTSKVDRYMTYKFLKELYNEGED